MIGITNIFKEKEKSCAEELNILDIYDSVVYTIDNKISLFIRVMPIAFEYLSSLEKENFINRLNCELAGQKDIIKIIVLSLPISTNEITDFLHEKRNKTSDGLKRNLLLKQINEINKLSFIGDMIEKRIYIQLFKDNKENSRENLERAGKEMVLRLQNSGIYSYILNQREIMQFFNAFLNMKYNNYKFNVELE